MSSEALFANGGMGLFNLNERIKNMALKLIAYGLGVCLAVGFLWFAAQVVVLGLKEFFKKNNRKETK